MDAKKANLNKDFKDRISPKSQFVKKRIPNVKKIIAISSAKGGVGKSTIAANIAVELGKNFNVGLLDADIYGPSIPQLFGVKEKPTTDDGKRLNPIIKFNVYLMSIGFLVDEKSPMVWRGPMVISAIKTFVNNVNWSSLDYLIIDMPPGTGDALITFSQELEIDGAIIVTTPQKLSVNDATRGIEMFKKTNVPILGVIENMSYLIDENNSKIQLVQNTNEIKEKKIISGTEIKSPIIGTAYLAPEPGGKKFVEIGKKIKKGDTVMIVEAMKTMNHVPSSKDGVVKEIAVDDGQPVEFGQTLVILE